MHTHTNTHIPNSHKATGDSLARECSPWDLRSLICSESQAIQFSLLIVPRLGNVTHEDCVDLSSEYCAFKADSFADRGVQANGLMLFRDSNCPGSP